MIGLFLLFGINYDFEDYDLFSDCTNHSKVFPEESSSAITAENLEIRTISANIWRDIQMPRNSAANVNSSDDPYEAECKILIEDFSDDEQEND